MQARVRAVLTLSLVITALLAVPPKAYPLDTGKTTTLKVALVYPRSPKITIEVAKYNKRICEMTDCAVQVRVYYGGVAGDDKTIMRKMRTGQIDGAPLGLELVSNFVREALVLASPGLFQNYKQVDAVRRKLSPSFNEEAYRNGFKVMGWGDAGKLRLFGKHKIQSLGDFKRRRPWLYPESEMGKEFYKLIGATGVPLGLGEVYGGMQSGMIDTYWSSAVLSVALQWHRSAKYMSKSGLGFISGAFVFRRASWDSLPAQVQTSMVELANEQRHDNQIKMRKYDYKSFKFLSKRGVEPVEGRNVNEWWEAGHRLRRRMIGRVYTRALVDRAEKIALKYADQNQLAHWKHL